MKLVTPVGQQGEVGAAEEGTEGEGEEAYRATVSESWIRIAFCFVEEARRKGVPMLCDGAFTAHTIANTSKEAGGAGEGGGGDMFPVRDPETGRVRRVKQEFWGSEQGAVEVVRRVYSLWVRDRMGGR